MLNYNYVLQNLTLIYILLFLQISGSEVDLSDKLGRTPLHYAASFVHSKLLSVLLNKGCTVDKQDTNGCTPLHYAAAAKYDDVL